MKKKILALILGTVLCLCSIFALSSCLEKDIKTKPIFDYIDANDKGEFDVKAITEKLSFSIVGEPYESSKTMLLTIEETRNLAAENPASYDTYRIYNLKTGLVIYEYVIDNLSVAEDRLTGVYFESNDDSDYTVIVKRFYDGYGNVDVMLLDGNGATVVEDTLYLPYYQYSSTGYALALLKEYEHHVMFDNVLYRANETGYEVVEDFNVSPLSQSALYNVKYVNGKFIAVDSSSITVYDKDLAFVSTFKPSIPSSANVDLLPLESGNVLVCVSEILDDDARDFDYKAPSIIGTTSKVSISYYVYDTASCVLNPVEGNEGYVIARVTEIDGLTLPEGCSLVEVNEISDSKLMSLSKYAIVDANGKILNLVDIPEGLSGVSVLAGNRALFTFTNGAKVIYSLDGTKICVVQDNTADNIGMHYVSNDETKVYDPTMAVIYEIPNDYEIIKTFNNDTILFRKNTALGKDEYYIWKERAMVQIDVDGIEAYGNAYATIKYDSTSLSTTYTLYDASGAVIKTLVSTASDPLDVEVGEQYGQLFVVATDKNLKVTIYVFGE